MLKYLLFYILAARAAWSTPLPTDVAASHIVIVTPQAQVHLEPGLKYDPAGTFIHHLSPLARLGSPHEETIVYVPASAAAPILTPIESVGGVGRASSGSSNSEQPVKSETKQWEQISQQIQQAVQQGSAQLGPQLSEAASAAAAAASAAGQGLFPALFPPPSGASATIVSSNKQDAEKLKLGYETPANTEPLLPASARVYALAPSVSHIVDFVHTPVFVGPLSAVRARSIQSGEAELPAAEPLASKPLALPLTQSDGKELPQLPQAQAEAQPQPQPLNAAESEKKTEFGRFLEANALKEEQQLQQKQQQPLPLESEQLKDSLPAATNQLLDLPKPALPAAESTSQLKSGAAIVAKDDAVDPLPQSKVA